MISSTEIQVRVVAFASTVTLRLHAGYFAYWRDEVNRWPD
jgi:hypothetical protein